MVSSILEHFRQQTADFLTHFTVKFSQPSCSTKFSVYGNKLKFKMFSLHLVLAPFPSLVILIDEMEFELITRAPSNVVLFFYGPHNNLIGVFEQSIPFSGKTPFHPVRLIPLIESSLDEQFFPLMYKIYATRAASMKVTYVWSFTQVERAAFPSAFQLPIIRPHFISPLTSLTINVF